MRRFCLSARHRRTPLVLKLDSRADSNFAQTFSCCILKYAQHIYKSPQGLFYKLRNRRMKFTRILSDQLSDQLVYIFFISTILVSISCTAGRAHRNRFRHFLPRFLRAIKRGTHARTCSPKHPTYNKEKDFKEEK